jgi:flagellin-like hook-associated protein FlgL
MRVTFNHFPDTLLGRLQSLGRDQNKSLIQLSSGQRIDAPSDDAPAMQRVLNLRTEKKQNQQFYRNSTDGLERSKVSFSSLEQIKDLLVRASELSANISGASSHQEYKAKAAEIDQLIQQGVNVANTKLRGNYLFSGDTMLQEPFQANKTGDTVTSVSYAGSEKSPEIRIGEGDTSVLKVATTAQENGDIAGILNEMVRMRDTMLEFNAAKVIALRTGSNLGGSFAETLPGETTIQLPEGHGLKAGDKIKLPSANGGLEPGKAYFIRSVEGNTIELSDVPGGDAIEVSGIPAGSAFERIGGLGELEDKLLSAMSRAGSIQYRLETAMKDLAVRYEATEQLISTDADVDFAEATIRLNRAQTAYQAAIQSGANIQSRSLLDYLR